MQAAAQALDQALRGLEPTTMTYETANVHATAAVSQARDLLTVIRYRNITRESVNLLLDALLVSRFRDSVTLNATAMSAANATALAFQALVNAATDAAALTRALNSYVGAIMNDDSDDDEKTNAILQIQDVLADPQSTLTPQERVATQEVLRRLRGF